MAQDVKKPPEKDVTYHPPDFRGLDELMADDDDDDRGGLTHLIGL